jgi:hypothetical protein
MLPFQEWDNILNSLEKHNSELSKVFEKYNEIKKGGIPRINDDEKITPEDQNVLVKLYDDHRTALEHIIECSKTLKTDIENLISFFERAEENREKSAKHISEQMRKHETRKNKTW